ncbi:hypothetical protein [Pseudonocardia sp. NPDC049635]|uniref:hypothetical protein n=1 Tax=Pseudonocardia sp. NPDC049635 TaxID=3155506 RepID=UPI0033F7B178
MPDAAEERLLATAADLTTVFVHAGHELAPVLRVVREAVPGAGRGRAWLAGERRRVGALTDALTGFPALAGRCVAEPYGQEPPPG